MHFNDHSHLKGLHAFLGASKYHWIRYSDEKIIDSYSRHQAALDGTKLHEFAEQCILLKQRLPRTKKTLNMFVNDAIGYGMVPELILFYSLNCFGTADALCFKKELLRIHDYKSGKTPAKMDQLKIYAAMFCLEYKIKPGDINIELRIYQNDEILYHEPGPDEILPITDKIVTFDKIITNIQ